MAFVDIVGYWWTIKGQMEWNNMSDFAKRIIIQIKGFLQRSNKKLILIGIPFPFLKDISLLIVLYYFKFRKN